MLKAIATSTVLQMLSLVLTMLDRIVVGGLMLKVWGVPAFEHWSVLIAAASLFGLLDFGLYMTYGNAHLRAINSGSPTDYARRTATALFVNGTIMIAGAILLFGLVYVFDWQHATASVAIDIAHARLTLTILGLAVIVQTCGSPLTTIYRGKRLFVRSLTVDLVATTARIGGVVLCLLAGGRPLIAATIQLAVLLVYIVGFVPWDLARTRGGVTLVPAIPTRKELADIAAMAPHFYAQQASAIALLNVPVLAIAGIVDAGGGVAVFVLTRTLVNMVRAILVSLANSVAIELSTQGIASFGPGALAGPMWRSMQLITVLSSAGFAMLVVLVGPFMQLWSGGKLQADMMLTVVLGSSLVVGAPYAAIANYLNYVDDVRIPTVSRLANLAVALGLGVLLAKPFGVMGIALALAAGEACGSALVYVRTAARMVEMTSARMLAEIGVWTLVGIAPVLAVGLSVQSTIDGTALYKFVFEFFAMAIVASWVLFRFGLGAGDRERLLSSFGVLMKRRRST